MIPIPIFTNKGLTVWRKEAGGGWQPVGGLTTDRHT